MSTAGQESPAKTENEVPYEFFNGIGPHQP
jgi:hypothetical protein